MMRFATRRIRNLAILILVAFALVIFDSLLRMTFRDAARTSGWFLLTLVLFLAAYNLFKKLPYFPLGASAAWLQAHIYAGLLTMVLFGLHLRWQVPQGIFESVLAVLYVLVATSGVCGLVISRVFARRLTARRGDILYDRIPRQLGLLRRRAERVVQECLRESESTLLPEFYVAQLEPFFATHCNLGHHLMDSSHQSQTLMAEIDAQRRYMNDAETKYLSEVADLVSQKDDLDYQFAHQATLKYWLFMHIPLTYALLAFAGLHVIVVHAF